MNIARAVEALFPGKKSLVDFLVEDDGSGPRIVKWNIDAPIPSDSELAAAWAEVQRLGEVSAYRRFRAVAYPPIGDQLDALWKGGAEAAAMKDQIMAVKAKYPKPA